MTTINGTTTDNGSRVPALQTALVRELVVAAVELAIVRNDLTTDDGEEGLLKTDSRRAIAADTWNALNGVHTCAGEPVKELARSARRGGCRGDGGRGGVRGCPVERTGRRARMPRRTDGAFSCAVGRGQGKEEVEPDKAGA